MPYIKEKDKLRYDEYIKVLVTLKPTEGELNYIFTKLALGVLNNLGENYNNLNAIIGIYESSKQEFYRRKVAPYEEKKISENGDVY